MKKKTGICLLLVLLLCCTQALADQRVALPGSRYSLTLPDNMKPGSISQGDDAELAYVSGSLEMDVFTYAQSGSSLADLAGALSASGETTLMTTVAGVEMLRYWTADEATGASCMGFIFSDGEQLVEITFWPTDGGAQAEQIMASLTAN